MNGIILAAGLGSRFNEMTKDIPKSLLPIGGKPALEITIEFLRTLPIEKIIIVIGHLKEKFYYLEEKYDNVILIENQHYADYNNIYSFAIAKEYFPDSFVIEADVVMLRNVFKKYDKSTYVTTIRQMKGTEWLPVLNDEGYVKGMDISDEKRPSLSGISYWNKNDGEKIIDKLNDYMSKDTLSNPKLYWDNIIIEMLDQLQIEMDVLPSDHLFEMDNKEQYEFIQKKYKELKQTP